MGLDYSYGIIFAEALGHADDCGLLLQLVSKQIWLHLLERYGSHKLKQEFLIPSIKGEMVASVAISESGGGSDVQL